MRIKEKGERLEAKNQNLVAGCKLQVTPYDSRLTKKLETVFERMESEV